MTLARLYLSKKDLITRFIQASIDGLEKHGVKIEVSPKKEGHVDPADVHIFWGMSYVEVIEHCYQTDTPFVCLDHGYTQDRGELTSINLNHLNNKSVLNVDEFAGDNSRCLKHGWTVKDPKVDRGGYDFVMGKIHDDRSLELNDVYKWAARKVEDLRIHRRMPMFKPHPKEKEAAIHRHQEVLCASFFGSMEEALNLAERVHTFSSTAGVHALLEGIPATAYSAMSMIYSEQYNFGGNKSEAKRS